MSRGRPAGRVAAAGLAAALCACGGADRGATATSLAPRSPLPRASSPRAPTTTTPLLSLAPPGADLVIEIDLGRVRANPVVGALFGAVVDGQTSLALARADRVLIASYSMGGTDARTLTILRGPDVPPPGRLGLRIDDQTVALGPPTIVHDVPENPGDASMADDEALLGLRDWAMPEKAKTASVRIAARLDFEARVELASLLELDSVPRALSVWGDVIDDLAVVALLAGDDVNDADDLVDELQSGRVRLAGEPVVRDLRLSYLLRNLTVERRGKNVRAVFVIEPRRLELVARRLVRTLEAASTDDASEPGNPGDGSTRDAPDPTDPQPSESL